MQRNEIIVTEELVIELTKRLREIKNNPASVSLEARDYAATLWINLQRLNAVNKSAIEALDNRFKFE